MRRNWHTNQNGVGSFRFHMDLFSLYVLLKVNDMDPLAVLNQRDSLQTTSGWGAMEWGTRHYRGTVGIRVLRIDFILLDRWVLGSLHIHVLPRVLWFIEMSWDWFLQIAYFQSTLDPSLRRHLLHELLSRLLQAGQWQIIIGADFATNTNMVRMEEYRHLEMLIRYVLKTYFTLWSWVPTTLWMKRVIRLDAETIDVVRKKINDERH